MQKLLIVGAGGYGKYVKEIAETIGYKQIDFLDDVSSDAVGKLEEIEEIQKDYDDVIVAIGNPYIRESLFARIDRLITLVHPSAIISKNASIGRGVIVEANVVIANEAVVKDGALICANSVINHNSVVNEFCQIDCNSTVGSFSNVPKRTKVNCCQYWCDENY